MFADSRTAILPAPLARESSRCVWGRVTQSFLNPCDMRGCMLRVRRKQLPSRPIRHKGHGRLRRQLCIGELIQELQRFLPRCRHIGNQHLHRVVAVRIDVGLIPLVGQCEAVFSAHRFRTAGETRRAGKRQAEQVLDAALILCQMGKVIFRSPSGSARNAARRTRTHQGFWAQPQEIRQNVLLRRRKGVQDF